MKGKEGGRDGKGKEERTEERKAIKEGKTDNRKE